MSLSTEDVAAYMQWRNLSDDNEEISAWRAALKHERETIIAIIHEQAMKDITVSNIEVALRERYKGMI